MKKYRLKKHIKVKLLIATLVITTLLIAKLAVNNYDKLAKECDTYYNTTCTHYDINNYKNIESEGK